MAARKRRLDGGDVGEHKDDQTGVDSEAKKRMRASKKGIAIPKAGPSIAQRRSSRLSESSVASNESSEKAKKKIGRPKKAARKVKAPKSTPNAKTITNDDKDEEEESDQEDGDETDDGPAFWLMKAEPESRIEKGKDVKFSIDDLQKASAPEPWDGVRNPIARNNMRAMLKGDQVFFYHSNCKVPGIVGLMEIVQEHSIDESAFDESHPYFDAKSNRDKPKWCVVHVEFRRKFAEKIRLKDLQMYAKEGGVLADMQVLRQSRLSVSKVSKKEWGFIIGLVTKAEEQHETA